MSALTLLVPGMTCRHCVRKVTAQLRDVPGVVAVEADASAATVVLHGAPAPGDVLAALVDVGYPGTVVPGLDSTPDAGDPGRAQARPVPPTGGR